MICITSIGCYPGSSRFGPRIRIDLGTAMLLEINLWTSGPYGGSIKAQVEFSYGGYFSDLRFYHKTELWKHKNKYWNESATQLLEQVSFKSKPWEITFEDGKDLYIEPYSEE